MTKFILMALVVGISQLSYANVGPRRTSQITDKLGNKAEQPLAQNELELINGLRAVNSLRKSYFEVVDAATVEGIKLSLLNITDFDMSEEQAQELTGILLESTFANLSTRTIISGFLKDEPAKQKLISINKMKELVEKSLEEGRIQWQVYRQDVPADSPVIEVVTELLAVHPNFEGKDAATLKTLALQLTKQANSQYPIKTILIAFP